MQTSEVVLPEEYPLFDVNDADIAFSTAGGTIANGGRYLDYNSGQTRLVPSDYVDKANSLFFNGGSLADVGLRPREGHDQTKIMRALRYLLSSWEPKHQAKEATVGFALMKWCEPIS